MGSAAKCHSVKDLDYHSIALKNQSFSRLGRYHEADSPTGRRVGRPWEGVYHPGSIAQLVQQKDGSALQQQSTQHPIVLLLWHELSNGPGRGGLPAAPACSPSLALKKQKQNKTTKNRTMMQYRPTRLSHSPGRCQGSCINYNEQRMLDGKGLTKVKESRPREAITAEAHTRTQPGNVIKADTNVVYGQHHITQHFPALCDSSEAACADMSVLNTGAQEQCMHVTYVLGLRQAKVSSCCSEALTSPPETPLSRELPMVVLRQACSASWLISSSTLAFFSCTSSSTTRF